MTTVLLEISGNGGEFQHHYLTKSNLKDILKIGKKAGADAIHEEYFTGGKMFDETNYGGALGCNIDATFTVNDKKIKPGKFVVEQKVDDKKPYVAGGNLYYITNAYVRMSIELEVDGKFDPKLLEIHYVDYNILEGTKTGKIISQVHYNGEEVFPDIITDSDDEDYQHVGCVYQVDSKGNYKDTDIFFMRDDEGWLFDGDVIKDFV